MLAIYFFGSAKVWKMSRVPVYRQEEARVILQARYEAQMYIAKKAKCTPEKVVLPEY